MSRTTNALEGTHKQLHVAVGMRNPPFSVFCARLLGAVRTHQQRIDRITHGRHEKRSRSDVDTEDRRRELLGQWDGGDVDEKIEWLSKLGLNSALINDRLD